MRVHERHNKMLSFGVWMKVLNKGFLMIFNWISVRHFLFVFVCLVTTLDVNILKSEVESLVSTTSDVATASVESNSDLKTEQLTENSDQRGAAGLLDQMPSFENMGNKGDALNLSMQDFYQEMINIWIEAKKREEQRKILYFSKLSQDHQVLLNKTQKQFSEFLEIVDIRKGLENICSEVHSELDLLLKTSPKHSADVIEEAFSKLKKLQTAIALDYCSFLPERMKGMSSKGIEDLSGVMNGLMQSLVPGQSDLMAQLNQTEVGHNEQEEIDPELVFTEQDVLDFCKVLSKLFDSNIFKVLKTDSEDLAKLKEEVENKVGIFLDILTAISHENKQELMLCYITYITPQFDLAFDALKEARKTFEKEVKVHISDQAEAGAGVQEKELSQKSYLFWLKEIKKNQRTLMAFSTLKNAATSSFSGTEKLFEIMAYAYDAAHCMFDFYKDDMARKYPNEWLGGLSHQDVLIPRSMDWAFRSGFAFWSFMVQRPNITGGLLYNSIMGNMPLNVIDLKQTTIFNLMAMPLASAAFISPSFGNWQLPKLAKSFGNIAGAWFYYHLVYCQLFGAESGDPLWPANNIHIKKSIYNCLMDVELELSKKFSSIVRAYSDPVVVEDIENYTLGIVKPEMIGVFLAAITPVILFKNENLYFNLPTNKFIGGDDKFFETLVGKGIVENCKAYNESEIKPEDKVSLEAYYLEATLVYYISSCIGKTVGTAFVKKYQGPMVKAASFVGEKCLNGLAKLNIISEDTAQFFSAFKDEFTEGIEENIMIFKMLFKEIFAQNSQIKYMLLNVLINRGDVSLSCRPTEEEINKKVAYFVLHVCAKNEWISYLDAAKISRKFIKKQQFDDEIIDELVLALKNNLIASLVGGTLGQWTAYWGARTLWNHYGPMYPKIKNWMNQPAASAA